MKKRAWDIISSTFTFGILVVFAKFIIYRDKQVISRIHLIICDAKYDIRVTLTTLNAKHVGLPKTKYQ